MTEKNNNTANKYFAAANTYRGFKSYFDSIFDSPNYDRIYVLKGGPGTGKSSFMRRVSSVLCQHNIDVEEIYCSSDPNSLDGVIVTNKTKKIAILDGTAPHERDAKIPGAIDEIINLADSLDKRWLSAKREDILAIGKEKSDAYKSAYFYLSLAGRASDMLYDYHLRNFDKYKAKTRAESFLSDIPSLSAPKIETRLISSFGRYGEYCLNTLTKQNCKVISVGKDKISAGLFMNECFQFLKEKKANFIHLPYALDPAITEAIYLPEDQLIITSGDGEVNAEEYSRPLPLDMERIKTAKWIHSEALEEAKRWFSIASDLHFRLEEIYGNAMNFEKNNEIIEEKLLEIGNILEITI